MGLKADGTVWTWGDNTLGQRGDGTTPRPQSPVPIGTGFASISAGGRHALAVKADGTLWAWGSNWGGQLGDGTFQHRFEPVQVGTGFASVAAGEGHSSV